MMKDLVVVKTFLQRHEAEMIKNILDNNNIESMISADDCGGVRPHLSYGKAIELLVKKEDIDKAKEILQNVQVSEEDKDLHQHKQQKLKKKHSSSLLGAIVFILLGLSSFMYSFLGVADYRARIVFIFTGILLIIASIGMAYSWNSVRKL
ncbi:putative signal transducing protein [Candidatus Omnitrophota bacterium]